jgi:PAS domain S-box-containing protein
MCIYSRFFYTLYNRNDYQYIVSIIKALFIGIFLTVIYNYTDWILAVKWSNAINLYCKDISPKLGYLIETYPIIGVVFSFITFTSIPLVIFFFSKWKKNHINNSKYSTKRIKELSLQIESYQTELYKERNRFKSLVDMQTDYMIKFNPYNGKITFINRSFYELLGFSDWEPVLNKSIFDYIKPDEYIKFIDIRDSMTVNDNQRELLGTMYIPLYSHPIYAEWKLSGIFRDGKLYKILAIGRDITGRREVICNESC